jgi:hypothetical protein
MIMVAGWKDLGMMFKSDHSGITKGYEISKIAFRPRFYSQGEFDQLNRTHR